MALGFLRWLLWVLVLALPGGILLAPLLVVVSRAQRGNRGQAQAQPAVAA